MKEDWTIRLYEASEKLIDKYRPFFGRKLHERETMSGMLAVEAYGDGGNLVKKMKYLGNNFLSAFYYNFMLAEVGIRSIISRI